MPHGATPGGVLEHPGVLKDPARVRESWHAVYGGSRNAGKVAVLEEGLKYQQIGIPPEEAAFIITPEKAVHVHLHEILLLLLRKEQGFLYGLLPTDPTGIFQAE